MERKVGPWRLTETFINETGDEDEVGKLRRTYYLKQGLLDTTTIIRWYGYDSTKYTSAIDVKNKMGWSSETYTCNVSGDSICTRKMEVVYKSLGRVGWSTSWDSTGAVISRSESYKLPGDTTRDIRYVMRDGEELLDSDYLEHREYVDGEKWSGWRGYTKSKSKVYGTVPATYSELEYQSYSLAKYNKHGVIVKLKIKSHWCQEGLLIPEKL